MSRLSKAIREWKYKRITTRKFQGNFIGSKEWLTEVEEKYGGVVQIENRATSLLDRYTDYVMQQGGDRMSNLLNGYSDFYQSFLELFVVQRYEKFTVCEVGILRGTGLAIWCDLFPNSRIIGLDLELSYFEENYRNLRKLGAFSQNSPEIYQFDQFNTENTENLENILKGDKVDICIDDGCHADEAILTTLKCMKPHLSNDFVYFVEDHKQVHTKIRSLYEHYHVHYFKRGGGLTIILPKP